MSKECLLISKRYEFDKLGIDRFTGEYFFENRTLFVKNLVEDGRLFIDEIRGGAHILIGGKWHYFNCYDYVLWCADDDDIMIVPKYEFKTRYKIIDRNQEEEG